MMKDQAEKETKSFLTDTHAHLDLFGSNESIAKVISAARRQGVDRILAVGESLESSRRIAGLTEQFSRVFGAVGVHPHHAESVDKDMMQQIWAVSNQPKIVALGETGLDFFRMHATKKSQISAFKEHIYLAKHLDLALIVHCREAYPETIKILKEADLSPARVVIHCFAGTSDQALALLDIGCYLSFAGNITFANAAPLRRAAKSVPLDRLLLETDCPYLAPHPHRGEQNQPALLPLVAGAVADAKGLDIDEVIKVTSVNADNLFGLSVGEI